MEVHDGLGMSTILWCVDKKVAATWTVWLSWLGIVLQTKESPVRLPMGACAWVEGSKS